jgi:hypothetical protein
MASIMAGSGVFNDKSIDVVSIACDKEANTIVGLMLETTSDSMYAYVSLTKGEVQYILQQMEEFEEMADKEGVELLVIG